HGSTRRTIPPLAQGGPVKRTTRSRADSARRPRKGMRAESAHSTLDMTISDAPPVGRPPQAPALPPEVARQSQREMDRLRRIPSGSPEAGQVRAYLQWLWSMPWDRTGPRDARLRHVEQELDQEHLGLEKAEVRIVACPRRGAPQT